METVRFLLGLVTPKGWCLFHLDIKSSFLNKEIFEEVFMEQPRGSQIEEKPERVYKLEKALYELKQAARSWFQRSETDHTLYRRTESNGDVLLACIYVDDMLCLSSLIELITEFKSKI